MFPVCNGKGVGNYYSRLRRGLLNCFERIWLSRFTLLHTVLPHFVTSSVCSTLFLHIPGLLFVLCSPLYFLCFALSLSLYLHKILFISSFYLLSTLCYELMITIPKLKKENRIVVISVVPSGGIFVCSSLLKYFA